MADIKVTEKLASIIKEERQKKKISAKDLSKYIGKSDSYISTLERNKIDYIKEDLLYEIFEKISNSSNKELEKYINGILADTFLSFKLNDSELKKQQWVLQLSLIVRQIPIPGKIISFITTTLDELNKTPVDLVRKINDNTYLEDKSDLEPNKLYVKQNGSWSYKFKIDDTLILGILNKSIKTSNYISMLGIIYNLYLFKGEDDTVAKNKADDFLKSNKFYDLKQIVKARQQHLNKEINNQISDEYSFELPKYEEEFDKSLKEIKKYINQLRDMKVDTAFTIVKTTESNLKIDAGFMNIIYSIPFGELFKKFTKEQKQEFLSDLSRLIKDTVEKNKTSQSPIDDYSYNQD
ncbi:helix-turn-helix transcriptional regulator [Clostridium sp. VAP51]|uniref:helix-turn-helix domain-containing protein n=1 Tax=Clostridium sp. VAP51 TaxID=2949978 RepID=UPI002079E198|nr:helix-turn-helix transcriptional regulator [Clostridium sp. VAP51]